VTLILIPLVFVIGRVCVKQLFRKRPIVRIILSEVNHAYMFAVATFCAALMNDYHNGHARTFVGRVKTVSWNLVIASSVT
jgi:hypothetical protein